MTNFGPVPFIPWGTSWRVRRSKNIHNEKASTFHETLKVGVKDAGREIGRTPIPVAESTRHPGEKLLLSAREHEREGPDQMGESTTPVQGQGGTVGEARGDHEGREPEWALPPALGPA